MRPYVDPADEPIVGSDGIDPPQAEARSVEPYDPAAILHELEPEAGRLLDRHLSLTKEWFPHDFIPYSQGRDFDKEPWTPDQPRLSGIARVAFEVNLLTEDNLPSYHRLIYGMFGEGDGAWINWVGSLDRRGRTPRHRAAGLPDRHAQPRSGGTRTVTHAPARARL